MIKDFSIRGDKAGIQAIHAAKIRLILACLDAAQDPKDMNLPGLRLHQLSGNYAGFPAVYVSENWRIVFRFENQDIVDVDYVDYH